MQTALMTLPFCKECKIQKKINPFPKGLDTMPLNGEMVYMGTKYDCPICQRTTIVLDEKLMKYYEQRPLNKR
jgi:hypothetical protein